MLTSTGGAARAQTQGEFAFQGLISAAFNSTPGTPANPQVTVLVTDTLHPMNNPQLTITLTAVDIQTPGQLKLTGGNGTAGKDVAYITIAYSFASGTPTMPANYPITINYKYIMTMFDYSFSATPSSTTSSTTYTGSFSGSLTFIPPVMAGGPVPSGGIVKLIVGQASDIIAVTTVVSGVTHRTNYTVSFSSFYSTSTPTDIGWTTTDAPCEIRANVKSASM
jgi:hypothetical protein